MIFMKLRKFWEEEWQKNPDRATSTHYRMLTTGSSEVILDIGCGSWAYAGWLLHESKYVLGCDISINALRMARSENEYHRKKTDLIQCDANYLPFRENAFDRVVSVDMITLMGKNHKNVLGEMCRVTRSYLEFNITHKDSLPVDKSNEILNQVGFGEEDIEDLLKSLSLQLMSSRVFTVEEASNFALPIYQWRQHPEGDKKMLILVTAKKQD
jgi:ubiquinone/menaquinone biosynthesis C-methylase UbiE